MLLVAGLAVDLSLPTAHTAWAESPPAGRAGEAPHVPDVTLRPLQLSWEDRAQAPPAGWATGSHGQMAGAD
mgnify:CR=1 FL=1